MSNDKNSYYHFGDFLIDANERLLIRAGTRVPLTPKAFDTLLVLVERHGHIVEKNDLMNLVWPDAVVEENNLNQYISTIRKVLGEDSNSTVFIETLPRRGYRFIAPVEKAPPKSHPESVPTPRTQTLFPISDNKPVEISPDLALARQRKSLTKFGIFSAIALSMLSGIGYIVSQRTGSATPPPPNNTLAINRLSATAGAWETAIAPDSSSVAYIIGDVTQQSLHLKNLETGNTSELLPPQERRFRGLTFAPDGQSVLFALQDKYSSERVLYQLSLASKEMRQVLTRVDSSVTFAPDGKRFAFVRETPTSGESSLVIANADGSGERLLITRTNSNYYAVEGPSWSPDGKRIAAAAANNPDFHFTIVTVDVDTGIETPIGQQRWHWAMKVAWLLNGEGLIVVGRSDDPNVHHNQLWRLSYPKGELSKLYADLNDYRSLSLDKTAQKLVSIRSEARSDLWIVPMDQPKAARSITNDSASQAGSDGIAWAPDGSLVFTSVAAGHKDLWKVQTDGSAPKQLTVDHKDNSAFPTITSDGKMIIFNSGRSGIPRIWGIGLDGKSPIELTHGLLDLHPFSSPLDRVIFFSQEMAGKRFIVRLDLDKGGQPLPLTDKITDYPVISPDGKLIACQYQASPNTSPQIAIIPANGGEPIELLSIPMLKPESMRWHPDGRSLTFLCRDDGSTNVWKKTLGGGPPEKITSFLSERIFSFAWSPDGRMLACSRGSVNRDIVLIGSFQ